MATKKVCRSKKKLRRRLKLQEQASREKFLERIKRHSITAGKEILVAPPDQAKMSEVLLEFAAPLLDRFESEIPVNKIIGVAIIAWNLSMFPEEDYKRHLDEIAGKLSLDAKGVKGMIDVMGWLVDRKRRHFAQHKKHILDYRLSELDDRRSFQVISIAEPANRP
jgi:hypothetical protein